MGKYKTLDEYNNSLATTLADNFNFCCVGSFINLDLINQNQTIRLCFQIKQILKSNTEIIKPKYLINIMSDIGEIRYSYLVIDLFNYLSYSFHNVQINVDSMNIYDSNGVFGGVGIGDNYIHWIEKINNDQIPHIIEYLEK